MKLGITKNLRGQSVLGSLPDDPENEGVKSPPAEPVGSTPERHAGQRGSEQNPYPMPERRAKIPRAKGQVYTSGPEEYSPEKGKYVHRAGIREGAVIPGITQSEHDRLTGDLKEDLKKGESVLFRAPGGGQYVITKDPFGEIIWDRFSRAHQPGDEPSRKIDYKDYF